MKFVVTGGAGFIGSAVVRELILNTTHEVINLDKLTYAGNPDSLKEIEGSSNYTFRQLDICDREMLDLALSEFQPEIILHLAAESHVDRSIEAAGDFIQTNIVGTYQLLEASRAYFARLHADQSLNFRFHHVSTDEVYGDLPDTGALFHENTPYAPSSPYAASKASSDHLVRAWHRTFGLPVVITNCSNNYGPYHFPEKLIPHIILSALEGKQLPIYGNGKQVRDWLFVEDHARALIKVALGGQNGQTYNIGGKNEKTNLEVVESICELLEELAPMKPKGVRKYSDLIAFVKDRPGHDLRYAVDARKLQQELSWEPRETFESGLRRTVEWYLNNQDWWRCILDKSYKLSRRGGRGKI